jgi:uncharacterized glyoxalase superfamily protein PhnB
MPDPFEALRTPLSPVAPDPAFTARLRARLARALGRVTGDPVPGLIAQAHTAVVTQTSLVPYLVVADGRRAIDWYVDVLGAVLVAEPIVMADGRVGHAELELNGARLYLAGEFPELELRAPLTGQPVSFSLAAQVGDVDRLTERAARGGALVERPPADSPHGRGATIRDPFGHRWILSAAPAAPAAPAAAPAAVPAAPAAAPAAPVASVASAGEVSARVEESALAASASEPLVRQGDIGYVSLWLPDVARGAAFFGSVLGWSYAPPAAGPGRQVVGTSLSHGLYGGQPRSSLFLCFVVDDVDAAVERVRAAGGTAEPPTDEPYGRLANCTDDQGMPFALNTPAPLARISRRAAAGMRHGDLIYMTLEVRDSARTRAFFDRVLGWQFTPGRVADGWNVVDVVPMSGLAGGHADTAVVPMYRVDDIGAAVARVRAGGGTSTPPARQPYGVSVECTDDQGTRFYLLES